MADLAFDEREDLASFHFGSLRNRSLQKTTFIFRFACRSSVVVARFLTRYVGAAFLQEDG